MEKISLLLEAINNRNIELFNTLLAQNTNVNEDFNGITPLQLACCNTNEEMTKLLLEAGADVNKKSDDGKTALYLSGNEIILQMQIDYGSDIYNIDFEGCTPLHRLCGAASLKIIKCLLKNGANINALDINKRTPVMHVLGRSDGIKQYTHPRPYEVLKFLLEISDINVIDRYGNNILNVDKKNKAWLCIILEHLAKLKVLDYFIHQTILDVILNDKEFKRFFLTCLDELQEAKSMKFTDSWVSFLNLLIDDKKKLIMYAGNQNIV